MLDGRTLILSCLNFMNKLYFHSKFPHLLLLLLLLLLLFIIIIIRHITDTPASEREFSETLRELDEKLKFLNLQSFNEYRSVYDVHDVLVKLKIKVRNVLDFILGQMYKKKKLIFPFVITCKPMHILTLNKKIS